MACAKVAADATAVLMVVSGGRCDNAGGGDVATNECIGEGEGDCDVGDVGDVGDGGDGGVGDTAEVAISRVGDVGGVGGTVLPSTPSFPNEYPMGNNTRKCSICGVTAGFQSLTPTCSLPPTRAATIADIRVGERFWSS